MGDAVTQFSSGAGHAAKARGEIGFQMRLDLAGEHGARPFGADGDGDWVAVDDGGGDEAGGLGFVDNVDQHTSRFSRLSDWRVQRFISGGAVGDEHAIEIAAGEGADMQRNAVRGGQGHQFRIGLFSDDSNDDRRLHQQPRLLHGRLAATNHQRVFAAQIQEYREVFHMPAPSSSSSRPSSSSW